MFAAIGSFFRMIERLCSAGEIAAESLEEVATIGLDKARAARASSAKEVQLLLEE